MWVFLWLKFAKNIWGLHHDVEMATLAINNNTKLLIFSIIRNKNWFKMDALNKLRYCK